MPRENAATALSVTSTGTSGNRGGNLAADVSRIAAAVPVDQERDPRVAAVDEFVQVVKVVVNTFDRVVNREEPLTGLDSRVVARRMAMHEPRSIRTVLARNCEQIIRSKACIYHAGSAASTESNSLRRTTSLLTLLLCLCYRHPVLLFFVPST